MADTLTQIRADVKTLISSTTILSDAEIDKAVDQAVATLSRFFPREVVVQTVFTEDITAEAWTSNHDTAVVLANKPIRFASETVTDSPVTTTYEKDTDYEIDYVNGTITALSTGTMSNSASHLITYKMDGTMIDISALLTEPISIDQVDVIRADRVPSEYESWYTHGDFLMITSSVNQSQMRFVDNDHIRIYYLAHHVEPVSGTSGSYPDFLDELVLIGTSGYGLLIEALQQEHQAITDLASARTSIGNIVAVHTNIGTAVTSLATAQSDANIALDKAFVEVALANGELDKIDTIDGGVPEAETELKLIIIALNTTGDFDTALDKVTTHTGEAITALALINTELLLGNTALDTTVAELESDPLSANFYLTTGDGLIDKVNVGRDAADLNRQYAIAKVQMAQTYVSEANGRFAHGAALAQEAVQRIQASISYIQEANARLRAVEAKLELATGWIGVSTAHHRSAAGYTETGRAYIQEGAQRLDAAGRYVEEIVSRINQIRAYLEEATTYHNSAESQRQSADLFRQEGTNRIREFINALEDRAQISSHPRVSSVRQYSSDNTRNILRWDYLN